MLSRILRALPERTLPLLGKLRGLVRPTAGDRERTRRDAIHRQLGKPERVAQGPFQGLRLVRWYMGHWLAPLLGTYEKEIWSVVEDICSLSPGLIVNVGAANGYYAVGLARRLPDTTVLAFEGDARMRRILQRTARANGVAARVEVRGWCHPEDLSRALRTTASSVVVADCEGAEDQLLDPNPVPELVRVPMLVEVHEHRRPGLSERLQTRFGPSRRIRVYTIGERTEADLPSGCDLTPEEARFAMGEWREAEQPEIWWLTPRGEDSERSRKTRHP